MNKFFFLFLILLFPSLLYSQIYSIKGYVKNSSNEFLSGVNIVNFNNNDGVSTDKNGYYSLIVNPGKLNLSISYIGFQTLNVTFFIQNDTSLNFTLSKKENAIQEIKVSAEKDFEKAESVTTISAKTINTLPALGGEKDIIKALFFIPGVQVGSEGTTGLFVRGGTSDQNLILIDNMPIYNISHLYGYMSVFDIDMVNSIEIIKAGFPASYGGKLSSVVKIDLKNGVSDSTIGNFTLGLISSKLQLEIPVKKNTYILISGRKTYLDVLSKIINSASASETESGNWYIGFYDFNFRLTSQFNSKNKIYFNSYFGDDKVWYETKNKNTTEKQVVISKMKTGNRVTSLTYKHFFDNNHSIDFVTGVSKYLNSNVSEITTKSSTTFENNFDAYYKIENYILDCINNLKYNFSNKFGSTSIGGEYIFHNYIPFSISLIKHQTPDSLIKYKPNEFAFFADNNFKLHEFQINTGLRYTQYKISSKKYYFFEPRISAKYNISSSLIAKASYTVMHQFNHLLTNISTGLPSNLWYPVNRNTKPLKSEQISIGISKSKIMTIFDAGAELYYKKMTNLIDFSNNITSYLTMSNIENNIEIGGTGKSYGLELFAHLYTDKLNGSFSYTLSKTDRKFENINSGKAYPFKYDRRHNLSSFLSYELSSKMSISATWTYMSGFAITLPIGRYYSPFSLNSYNPKLVLYTDRNQYRMPAYHRLDIAWSHKKKKEKGIRIFEISIYNAYNRQNAYSIEIYPDYNYTTSTATKPKAWQITLLPIIPSISYTYQF